ncbi:MAG: alpha/beta hydrolase [Anaerolineae bacterium]|nr:alpha/beta hydrolase [Anaerolineae bacterium]
MTETITLDGHKLVYTTAGQPGAPALVMIHGWTSHHGVWQKTVDAFRNSHYCVALDLLGFGDSDKPKDGDYSIEAQGQRVLQLADALELGAFTLIGHSMGGQIALCIASMLAPDRVTKLVSVSGVVAAHLTPVAEREGFRDVRRGKLFPLYYALGRWAVRSPSGAGRGSFRNWFYDMDAIPYESWEIDRRMTLQTSARFSNYEALKAIYNLDLTKHLSEIACPTLVIFGRQDAIVPVADGHLVEQHVPSSQMALIDRCGHFPMYEQAQQYLDTVRAFLTE